MLMACSFFVIVKTSYAKGNKPNPQIVADFVNNKVYQATVKKQTKFFQ